MDLDNVHRFHQQLFYNRHQNSQEPINRWNFTRQNFGVNAPYLNDIDVQLDNKQLWEKFHAETTEMIITKLGRRMFPAVQINVNGLDRHTRYCVLMEIIPASKRRHKYIGNSESIHQSNNSGSSNRHIGWTTAGAAEPQPPIDRRIYLHPDSPATGAHWMQQSINFTKLKLTNNGIDHHNNVVLTSMHKYIPRIWIIRAPETINSITNLFNQPAASFTFPETVFVAVTAYQNENITKLKINNNPFAKGFRETGQSRCKRKFDGSHCDRIIEDDEGGNISSDSESHDRSAKRIMSDTASSDDSGVSSSDGVTPPPTLPLASTLSVQKIHNHHSNQPKLHRPWTDSHSQSSLDLTFTNIASQKHSGLDVTFQTYVPPTNHLTRNFVHFPIFFHPIGHHQTFNTAPSALSSSRYQYYQPPYHQMTKIYR